MLWKIFKYENDADAIEVEVDSFDEALAIARKIDKAFCAGFVVKKRSGNKNMISAVEMHKITEESSSKFFEQVLEKVNQQILSTAKEGKYSMDICINSIDECTRDWSYNEIKKFADVLEEFGYKVGKIRDGGIYANYDNLAHVITVSW